MSGNDSRKSEPEKPSVLPVTAERETNVSLREMCTCLHAFREVMEWLCLQLSARMSVHSLPSVSTADADMLPSNIKFDAAL